MGDVCVITKSSRLVTIWCSLFTPT